MFCEITLIKMGLSQTFTVISDHILIFQVISLRNESLVLSSLRKDSL